MKVKKGDEVVVIAGKDRGVKGKVILADPASQRVLVEGVNRIKKHTKVVYPNGVDPEPKAPARVKAKS